MKGENKSFPIDRVFAELMAKGLISSRRRLRRKKATWSHTFKAGILRPKNIYYNEMYSSLADDLLGFALLHEEGHHTTKQNWKILVGFIVAGFGALTYFYLLGWYLGHPSGDALNFACVVMFFLSLLSLRAFETPLQEDETRSDLHSARTMVEKLGIQKPSIAATALFKILDERKRDRTSLSYRTMRFIGGGIHPPDTERIKAIRELEESIAEGADEDGNALH